MKYIQNRKDAEELLCWAESLNPGPWIDHSKNVAIASEILAISMKETGYEMNIDIAYICGLLHDIGRYKGVTPSIIHSWDGYQFLVNRGFQGTANTCITHSFPKRQIEAIVGWDEVPSETQNNILIVLDDIEWSMYDKLVTLCDSLADSKGFSLIEKRVVSAAIRNGANQYTPNFWKGYYEIKQEIEKIIGTSIYKLLPGIEESLYTPVALVNKR